MEQLETGREDACFANNFLRRLRGSFQAFQESRIQDHALDPSLNLSGFGEKWVSLARWPSWLRKRHRNAEGSDLPRTEVASDARGVDGRRSGGAALARLPPSPLLSLARAWFKQERVRVK